MQAHVEVWADIRCPWCWVGHRRLGEAVSTVTECAVSYRSFLLEPQGPEGGELTVGEAAVTSWGLGARDWAERSEAIRAGAAEDGLTVRMDTALNVDSRPAHRLLKIVQGRGLDVHTAWDTMFAAHLEQNLDITSEAVLRALGTAMGLTSADLVSFPTSDRYAAEVTIDHVEGVHRGVRSVPTVVVGEHALAGRRDVEELRGLLRSRQVAAR